MIPSLTRALRLLSLMALAACVSEPTLPRPSGDEDFGKLAAAILEDGFRRHPSAATDLGLHTWDDQLDELSRDARLAELQILKVFRDSLALIDPASLTPA